MDLITAVLWALVELLFIPHRTATLLNWFLWAAFLCIPLACFVTEEAHASGFRAPVLWGVFVGIMPPFGLPVFLLARGALFRSTGRQDTENCRLRRRGWIITTAALVAIFFLAIAVVEVLSGPETVPRTSPAKRETAAVTPTPLPVADPVGYFHLTLFGRTIGP